MVFRPQEAAFWVYCAAQCVVADCMAANFAVLFQPMNETSSNSGGERNRREVSRGRILETLRGAGTMSRAALGRATGLSPASVSAITGALIAEGVLVEDASAADLPAGPGRPGQRLGFNPRVGAVLGLWVGLDRLILRLADHAGGTIAAMDERMPLARLAEEDLIGTLARRISAFSEAAGGGLPLLGVGIAFQGFVDQRAGKVVWSPVTRTAHLPLVAGLEAALGVPVELDNDASAMAFAITRADPSLRDGVTACVMLGDGVGLGVFVDGRPLRGAHGAGIEFGHVRMSAHGPQCRCGGRGCIESFLADYALYRDALAVSDLPPPAEGRQPSEAEMVRLVARARTGEAPLTALFEAAGQVLADGITMLTRLFQPDTIVLCGPGLRAWSLMEPAVLAGLSGPATPRFGRSAEIRALPFEPDLLTEGVIAAALDRIDGRHALLEGRGATLQADGAEVQALEPR